jgi:hypothetical protein
MTPSCASGSPRPGWPATPGPQSCARRLLWDKYPQFGDAPPEEAAGPVMAVDIEQWAGWAYSP